MRVYDAITMHRAIGCGNIYVIFNENDGVFYNIIIKGDNAREAPCGESWLNSMAAILTYALRQSLWEGTAQEAIIKHLLNHRCNRIIPNKEHICSCAHAIGVMCLEYIKARGLEDEAHQVEAEKEEAAQAAKAVS